jgi:hypothetical protein
MPLKIGNTNISTIYKGNTKINKIYKGSTLVYQSGVLPKGDLQTDAVRYRNNTRIVASNGNISDLSGYSFYVLPIPQGATTLYLDGNAQLKPSSATAFGYNNNYNASNGWSDRIISSITSTYYTITLKTNYAYVGLTLNNGAKPIYYEFKK